MKLSTYVGSSRQLGGGGIGGGARLPFAVDTSRLRAAAGALWAAVERRDAEASAAVLDSPPLRSGARLDGFKARELRASQGASGTVWRYELEWFCPRDELSPSSSSAHANVLVASSLSGVPCNLSSPENKVLGTNMVLVSRNGCAELQVHAHSRLLGSGPLE